MSGAQSEVCQGDMGMCEGVQSAGCRECER